MLLLVFFSLRRYRLVSFHICKASRRSSKFCLCRSLTSISRPSSFLVLHRLPRALLSFPFFLLVFFLGSYRNSRLPRRTRSHLLVLPSDLWVAENWPKRSRKNRRKSDLPSSFLLAPLLRHFLLHLSSFLYFAQISCVCVQRASTASRERDRLFSERPTDTSLITTGLDSCGCLRRAPGRNTGTVTPRS